ncbi:MAG: Uma2 family endonuclease [Roseiflexaceae bacterium]|nr:Uma2 family endonuclease [Roseiflexaceae bacterium]
MSVETITIPAIIYPERDGVPVGETDDHRDQLFDLVFSLKNWLRDQTAYVGGNLMMYYEEGVPSSVISPDVFVIQGVQQQPRRTYKTWEYSGKFADVVIELTSAKTRYEDLGTKRVLYAQLGVREYYLFDPLGEYLKPRLRGYQLLDEELEPLPGPRMHSRILNLELQPDGRALRLIDLASGQRLPIPQELEAARQREAEGRAEAEAEVLRLRAELDRLKRLAD